MAPEQARVLDIGFKGDRNYLHGTDLFDTLVAMCVESNGAPLTNLRMSFYRPMLERVEALRFAPAAPMPFRPTALLELNASGHPLVWALRERRGEPVTGRRPYDEDLACGGAVSDGHVISQAAARDYTFIERTVALNKRMLDGLRRDAITKWWFARIELGRVPASASHIRLHLETEPEGRLVKSAIEVDGSRLGHIYFSEKRGA